MSPIPIDHLRTLRNDVAVLDATSNLRIPTKTRRTPPRQHTPGSCGTPLSGLQGRTRGQAKGPVRADNTKDRTTPPELGVTAPRFFFQNGRKSIPPRPIWRRSV